VKNIVIIYVYFKKPPKEIYTMQSIAQIQAEFQAVLQRHT